MSSKSAAAQDDESVGGVDARAWRSSTLRSTAWRLRRLRLETDVVTSSLTSIWAIEMPGGEGTRDVRGNNDKQVGKFIPWSESESARHDPLPRAPFPSRAALAALTALTTYK